MWESKEKKSYTNVVSDDASFKYNPKIPNHPRMLMHSPFFPTPLHLPSIILVLLMLA